MNFDYSFRMAAIVAIAVISVTGTAFALPKLEEPVPMPADLDELVTAYPDNHNTTAQHHYWLAPNTARIVTRPNGDLAFGLVHSGVSGHDPDGVNALLNCTFQPHIDAERLTRIKTHIEEHARRQGARTVTFSFISPKQSTCQLLVGGQFYDWNGQNKTIINGGSVDAGIPFQIKVTDSFDVRCLSQAGGEKAALFGVLYTMKFDGVGSRVHFVVTADFRQVLDHFKAEVAGSAWFGAVKANWRTEWTRLKDSGAVKLTVYSGTEEQVEKYHANKIVDNLLTQLAARTGMFARTVKPSELPGAPGGGGRLGWGVSVGGGFEHVEDTSELRYVVDAQFTREQEIVFGMNFPIGGQEMIPYVKNLTHPNIPFPTADDFKRRTQEQGRCLNKNLLALKRMLDEGLIDRELWLELVKDACTRGCYVDYSGVRDDYFAVQQAASRAYTVSPGHAPSGSKLSIRDYLEFIRKY